MTKAGNRMCRRRAWGAAGITGALLSLAAPAAACTATLSKSSPDPVVDFDPFAGETGNVELALAIDRPDGESCELGLAIAEDVASGERELQGSAQGILRYVVESPDGAEFPNSLDQPLPIATTPGGTSALTVRIRVPAGQMAAAGDFTGQIRLRLVDLDAGQVQVGEELGAVVRATVPSRAQVNLAGSAGHFDPGPFAFAGLDFGEMTTGDERSAFVQIRATRPVTVTLVSQNGGALRRIGSADPGEAVSYALSLSGNALDLSQGAQSVPAAPPVSLDGQSYPLSVRLTGDTSQLPAGQYRDVVTIEVTPN